VLGKAIKAFGFQRESIVVLTKVYFPTKPDDLGFAGLGINADEVGLVNQHGLSRKHIFESIKLSLERLQLDYVDVLQCHRFDYNTPISETMQALHDIVQAGHARYIGMSSCHAYQFHAMQNYAINNNLTPFISMQDQYSAVYREEEREMFPTLKLFGVGSIPWSPLARGYLTRPVDEKSLRSESDKNFSRILGLGGADESAVKEINRSIEKIAVKRNLKMAQIALAWVLSKDIISAPIIGTTKLESLKELVDAVGIELTQEEIKSIEEPYVPRAVLRHQ